VREEILMMRIVKVNKIKGNQKSLGEKSDSGKKKYKKHI
jgi:hypothetical protein